MPIIYDTHCVSTRNKTMLIFSFIMEIILTFNFKFFISQLVSSVAQSCLTLGDPVGCSTPGIPVRHQLPEFTLIHVH